MKMLAATWDDARYLFWLRAERLTVQRLMRRRTNGEKLTDREQNMVAYSPFGTGSWHSY